MFSVSFNFFFFFNTFNYQFFNYYLLNNSQVNSMFSVYNLLNSFSYYFFIGISFIIVSHVIISVVREYLEFDMEENSRAHRLFIWYIDFKDIYILPKLGLKKEFDPIDFILNPNSLSKPIFRRHL